MSVKSCFLLSWLPAFLLAAAQALPAATPVYSVAVDPSGASISVRLRHDEGVRGGNIGFVVDPDVLTITGVARGADIPGNADLFSTLFQDDTADPDTGIVPVSNAVTPIDSATGEPVPGGVLLGWINSFEGDVVLAAGDHEIFVLIVEPAAGAMPGSCGDLVFRDGLQVPPAPPQNTIVTDVDALTVPAAGESAALCLCDTGGCVCAAPRILTAGTFDGQETVALDIPLAVEGLEAPLAWSATGLPFGLGVDTGAGEASITGVPELDTAGDYDVTVEVCGACGGGSLCVEEILALDIVPPPAVVSPAPIADQIVIDGGATAIAFAGSVTAPPGTEMVVLDAATFENIGGADAADRIVACSIAIDDGDGVFTALDRVLPPTASFDPTDQTVTVDGLAESFGPGETLTFYLICDLAGGSAAAGAGPAGTPLRVRLPEGPLLPAGLLAAAAALLFAGAAASRPRPRRALAAAGAPLFIVFIAFIALAVAAGCSSGGDGNADRLQMRLTGLDVFRTPSGEAVPVDGIPSTGRPF